MKKHNVIVRTENGLQEVIAVSTMSARDLKKANPNIVTVTATDRVTHPSPEVLVETLNDMGVNLQEFYQASEQKMAVVIAEREAQKAMKEDTGE